MQNHNCSKSFYIYAYQIFKTMYQSVIGQNFQMCSPITFYPTPIYYTPAYPIPSYYQYSYNDIIPHQSSIYGYSSTNYFEPKLQTPIQNEIMPKPENQNVHLSQIDERQCFTVRVPRRKQNPNRNLNSNILKHFLKYITSNKKAQNYICKLIQFHKLSISYKSFVSFLSSQFRSSRNYVRPTLIAKLCRQTTKNKAYSLLIRIMLSKFLKLEYNCVIFNSSKEKNYEKIEELRTAKNLLKELVYYNK